MKTFLFILKNFWKAPTELVLVLRVRLLAPKSLAHFPRNSKPENSLFLHFDPCINRARSVHESQSSFLTLRNVARRLPFHFMDLEKGVEAVNSSLVVHTGSLDLEKGVEAVNSSLVVHTGSLEVGAVLEPYVGMEFDSEDAARKFYVEYARRVGFVVRIMQRRRSGIDGRTLARRLGCNKQGFSPNQRGTVGPEKKPRPSAREGCRATILVRMEKSGKWVVSRFESEHNHPLVATANGFSTAGDKDKKIEELMRELEHQEQLCAAYREKLLSFMNNVEEQTEELSSKIQVIVDNVRKVESEVQKLSHHR